ncbi:MAG: hypothetical protein QUS14_00715, partial [Pyrinomonadaceae bacterium]|nr:hypothetical protein [Pyrinomonadaceae bacterium]
MQNNGREAAAVCTDGACGVVSVVVAGPAVGFIERLARTKHQAALFALGFKAGVYLGTLPALRAEDAVFAVVYLSAADTALLRVYKRKEKVGGGVYHGRKGCLLYTSDAADEFR